MIDIDRLKIERKIVDKKSFLELLEEDLYTFKKNNYPPFDITTVLASAIIDNTEEMLEAEVTSIKQEIKDLGGML